MKRTSGMRWMKVVAVLAALAAGGGLASTGRAADAPRKPIKNTGSDTMIQVAQAWAVEYRKATGGEVTVTGGGSGVGIKQLIEGTIQIANSSRDMTAEEIAAARKNTGKEPVETIVGYDGIGIYVHKDNPVTELTMEDLAGIYGEDKKITKWSQLGVKNPGGDEIVVVSRQNSSGTYEFFQDHVLHKHDFRQGMLEMSGSKEVVELVGKTPGAIGYSGMGYKTDAVKFVPIAVKKGEKAVLPSVENVLNKSYPLARSLNMYTLGPPEGDVKKYIDWVLSPAGQKVLEAQGYISMPSAAKAESAPAK